MQAHIRTCLADGVMSLTLDRAQKRNALDDAMYGALAAGLAEALRSDSVRAVLIEADGAHFCAGNDIADFVRLAAPGAALEQSQVVRFLTALAEFDKPLVAAVQGQAVGIGLTLLLHADMVWLAADARLSAPFVALGLVPEAASSVLLPQRVGQVRAFELFAGGRVLKAEEALAWGLANQVVAVGELHERAQACAVALAAQPQEALRACKRLMRDGAALRAVVQRELVVFAERLQSAEARAVFAAFMARAR